MDTRAVVLRSVEDDAMSQRILVVDDDPSITKVVRAYLEQAGYEVLTAADGEQTLRLVRQERPELVVLDVMLPNRDGWEITRRIRADPTTVRCRSSC
jgi:two-component system, OmpR family, alkaline phosphatase synthesis response regulator PhoP